MKSDIKPRFGIQIPVVDAKLNNKPLTRNMINKTCDLIVLNISETGIGFVIDRRLCIGDNLTLKLDLSNTVSLCIFAIIKRVVPFQDNFYVGSAYGRLNEETRKDIKEYVLAMSAVKIPYEII